MRAHDTRHMWHTTHTCAGEAYVFPRARATGRGGRCGRRAHLARWAGLRSIARWGSPRCRPAPAQQQRRQRQRSASESCLRLKDVIQCVARYLVEVERFVEVVHEYGFVLADGVDVLPGLLLDDLNQALDQLRLIYKCEININNKRIV